MSRRAAHPAPTPLSTDDPLHSPGLHGRLRFMPRAFRMGLEDRMRAAAGVPSWIRRTRELELLLEELGAALDRAWRQASPATWEGEARAWNLGAINAAIMAYNANFPIERDLPMSPRTRDFEHDGAPWKPLPVLDTAWILERFPPASAGDGGPSRK